MKKYDKQRLFEVMSKLDNTFMGGKEKIAAPIENSEEWTNMVETAMERYGFDGMRIINYNTNPEIQILKLGFLPTTIWIVPKTYLSWLRHPPNFNYMTRYLLRTKIPKYANWFEPSEYDKTDYR